MELRTHFIVFVLFYICFIFMFVYVYFIFMFVLYCFVDHSCGRGNAERYFSTSEGFPQNRYVS